MKSLTLLLIEDDNIEALKFNRILSELRPQYKIIEARNGEQALEILSVDTSIPDLILLDLNMPRMNGLEFLNILKKDQRLKYLPVVVLTTSKNRKDVKESYNIGIAGYVMKPLRYEDYKTQLNIILNYWSTNELTTQ